MKASIIVFSPSGHTLKISEQIKTSLQKRGAKVQLIDITKDDDYLSNERAEQKLKNELAEHDILFIGGPLYAGHVEHHVLEIINRLPAPNEKFGRLAVPFVTYGGVHTSIALEEMGKLIKKSSRKSLAGIKVTAEHTLTKDFDKFINEGKPGAEELEFVDSAVEKIVEMAKLDYEDIKDVSKELCYSNLKERILFHAFSQESFHKKYKGVSIDYDKCIGCGKCVAACPVNMYRHGDECIEMQKDNNKCILCAECYYSCPVGAISFPYSDKVRNRLKDGHAKMEQPQNEIYF